MASLLSPAQGRVVMAAGLQAAPRPGRGRAWTVPVLLVALSAIPVVSGTLRVVQLSGGPQIMPADHRFTAFPVPVVLHVFAAVVYALAGVFQFLPALRRRGRSWHRRAGRIVATAGLLVAVSGVWMTLGYSPKPGTGDLLYVARLVVGSAMLAFLILGVSAIRHGDVRAHRAWMIRAYALGLGAGTQAFTQGFGGAVFGSWVLAADLEMIAGWVINLLVAEWAIRRTPRRRPRPPRRATARLRTDPGGRPVMERSGALP